MRVSPHSPRCCRLGAALIDLGYVSLLALRHAEEKLRELELRSQRELSEKRQELMAKEELLRNLEARLSAAQQQVNAGTPPPPSPIGSTGPAHHAGEVGGETNGLQ